MVKYFCKLFLMTAIGPLVVLYSARKYVDGKIMRELWGAGETVSVKSLERGSVSSLWETGTWWAQHDGTSKTARHIAPPGHHQFVLADKPGSSAATTRQMTREVFLPFDSCIFLVREGGTLGGGKPACHAYRFSGVPPPTIFISDMRRF